MSKKMYYATQNGMDVVFLSDAITPDGIRADAEEYLEKERQYNNWELPPIKVHEVNDLGEIPFEWRTGIPWGQEEGDEHTSITILERKDVHLDGVVYIDGMKFVRAE